MAVNLQRSPQITLKKCERDYCEFELTNTDISVANALRRVIFAQVAWPGHVHPDCQS